MNRFSTMSMMGIACLLIFALVQPAEAYVYRTCNGTPVRWSSQVRMFRDRCSMPDNSDADWAYWNTGWNWWQITNRIDWNWWYDSGCTITNGNGRNETALVVRSQISGANGLTTTITDGCTFSWETEHTTETDIRLANDHYFGPEDESFWHWSNTQQGRVVAIHEWGHALGLQHAEGFDTMRAFTPLPVAGGNTSEPYGDDANGARFLYGGASTNMFASAQKFSGSAISATNVDSTINVCRNQAISVTYTVANNGSVSTTSGFRIFIHNGPANIVGGWNMFNGTATVNAGNQFTETRTLTVPFVTPGIYWILWQIDTGNTVGEFNESDNAVHSAMTLNVLNC
jgi:CARDB/Matrixin